jgi:hypothetical protein
MDFRGQTIGSLRGRLIGSLRPRSELLSVTRGFMLLPQPDTSLLVSKKQTNLENLYPATAEYDSAPVYRERTFMFRPTGGMGESVQSAAGDRRYHWGINVWVTGGLFGKGPLVHPIVPSPGTVPPAGDFRYMTRKWAEGRDAAGSSVLYYISKQQVYRRDGDDDASQFVARTRAGHYPTDMVRFMGAYASNVDALYVAWEDGVLEEFNTVAGTWATCTLPSGFLPQFLTVVGDELWAGVSSTSVIRKCTADPKVAGSWSGPILIGTPTMGITALASTANRLAIFKADGSVFTLNSDGSDNDLFPGLRTSFDTENGRTASAWLDSLWFRAGRAWYQLELAGTPILTPRGPGRNLGNLSEVRGPIQALAGWNTQMAFCAIYNEQLGNSYLLSYGSWVPKADPGATSVTVSGTAYTFVDQYDGALKKWTGRKVTSMFVSNVPTEARLYVGFLDGGYDWIKLVPYPLLPGTGSEYTLEQSYLVMPVHHAMFQADTKHWTGATIFGNKMDPGDRVFIGYRLKGAASGVAASPTGDFISFGDDMTEIGMRCDCINETAGQAIELQINFDSTSSNSTPVLEGLGLHERLVPRFRRDYTMTVNANDFVARRDGASARQSGVAIRAMMEQAATTPSSTSIVLPDERVNQVALFTYEEHQVPHTQRGGQGWAITVQATEFTTKDIYGIIGRLRGTTIGSLRGFTIDQLRIM